MPHCDLDLRLLYPKPEEKAIIEEAEHISWCDYGNLGHGHSCYVSGFLDGRTRWHDVRKEGLPTDRIFNESLFLLYTDKGSAGSPVVAIYDGYQFLNIWTGDKINRWEVLKWQDVILPKE